MEFKFVPLAARRDMAMLGMIHRTVLGKGPEHFKKFFKLRETGQQRAATRFAARRHDKQLEEPRKGCFPELLRRSALGLVAVYNLLPKAVVDQGTVKDFQRELQELLTKRAAAGCEDWRFTFSPRVSLWKHPLGRGSRQLAELTGYRLREMAPSLTRTVSKRNLLRA